MSSSNITKYAIANSLKRLCLKKNFDKVSISDITEDCGLNRQTFYYHFEDKYELLNWIYYNYLFADFIDGIDFGNWDGHLQTMMEKMQKDKHFYTSTIKAAPDNFTDILFKITQTLFVEAINNLDDGRTQDAKKVNFYASFFAYGCGGVILDWIKNDMSVSPAEISGQLHYLAEDTLKLGYRIFESRQTAGQTGQTGQANKNAKT